MGNGDMLAALGGPSEDQRFYLSKNDLWRLGGPTKGAAKPVGFGHLAIRIPAMRGATYDVRQSWDSPATTGVFKNNGTVVHMTSRVAAARNLLLVDLAVDGHPVEVEASLHVALENGSKSRVERRDDIVFGQRTFEDGVAVPSGAAVAWKVLGTESTPLDETQIALQRSTAKAQFPVQIGREQHGGGRWRFEGAIDDLRVYDRVLIADQIKAWEAGNPPKDAAHVWTMETAPKNEAIQVVERKRGKAWRFSGNKDAFIDGGELELPIDPVTVGGWVRIDKADQEANYIFSCGEWNQGVSLGLSAGKLRFAVEGSSYVESPILPRDRWLHIVATRDGRRLAIHINGKKVAHRGMAAPVAGVRFALKPGKPVTLILGMDSMFKNLSYAQDVVTAVSDLSDESDLTDIREAHAAWWADYWSKSWVTIADPALEQAYYRSLYGMGACSRDPRFPPGIFGWVTTDSPMWNGDYHLNYNHMAPFYALYSANRIEQGDAQDAPILDFMETAQTYAKRLLDSRGVLYPVGVGPMGVAHNKPREFANRGMFWGQRSNGLYCMVNMAQRWRCTYDPAYGRKIYPLVREVVDFWEDNLTFEDGRYVIYGDSVHEGSGNDMNPILTLGLLRNGLDLAIDMSQELKVDADRRAKWQHILKHLSSWTTQEKDGKTVFRYTEKGTAWWRDNTLGIQHIYPGNALGRDSDSKWIEVAHNTIGVMQRWLDFNGTNSLFPAAVRVGYDPKVILGQLRKYAEHTYPNGFQVRNPHGIENFSTVPNTINEMLCMSHDPVGDADRLESVIRLFAVWPKDRDARFEKIRTWGAFLVSSELKNGEVQFVRIHSERGRECTMVNPWPGKRVVVHRNGKNAETYEGERLSLATTEGEILLLGPVGLSLQELQSRIR